MSGGASGVSLTTLTSFLELNPRARLIALRGYSIPQIILLRTLTPSCTTINSFEWRHILSAFDPLRSVCSD